VDFRDFLGRLPDELRIAQPGGASLGDQIDRRKVLVIALRADATDVDGVAGNRSRRTGLRREGEAPAEPPDLSRMKPSGDSELRQLPLTGYGNCRKTRP
jgi:hypothetical protein